MPASQSAATGADDDRPHVGALLEDFQAGRRLPGHDVGVVERVNQHRTGVGGERDGLGERLVNGVSEEPHVGAVLAGGLDLRQRRTLGHEHRRLGAEQRRGERDALRMIAGAGRDDAAGPLGVRQSRDADIGAANLERSARAASSRTSAATLPPTSSASRATTRSVCGARPRRGARRPHARRRATPRGRAARTAEVMPEVWHRSRREKTRAKKIAPPSRFRRADPVQDEQMRTQLAPGTADHVVEGIRIRVATYGGPGDGLDNSPGRVAAARLSDLVAIVAQGRSGDVRRHR